MYQLFVLLDFSPIKPDLGLIFWTTIIFLIFWFLIGKAAFKPIAKALKTREDDIQAALDEAKKAREEMANLKAENEVLLAEAREEKSKIIKAAKVAGTNLVEEAKSKAKKEAKTILTNAKMEIENQKNAALIDIRNQVGTISISIAEKLLNRELSDKPAQENFVGELIKDIKLN